VPYSTVAGNPFAVLKNYAPGRAPGRMDEVSFYFFFFAGFFAFGFAQAMIFLSSLDTTEQVFCPDICQRAIEIQFSNATKVTSRIRKSLMFGMTTLWGCDGIQI
jgi:hypothetical protein